MAITPVSSSSVTVPPPVDPLRQAFGQLTSALQSGDLSAAQSAYTTLMQAQPSQGSGPFSQALSQIGDALQSGDLGKAQQALASLQQQMQATRARITTMAIIIAMAINRNPPAHRRPRAAIDDVNDFNEPGRRDSLTRNRAAFPLTLLPAPVWRPQIRMFDTIILLTGPVEEAALAAVLRQHNPQLDIQPAKSLNELEAIDQSVLAHARLVAFVTPVLVPARILGALGFGAYNFHPGPPQYPGWAPSHFAIYDKASYFGATAHAMIEQVDAGPIVGFKVFSIPPNTSVLRLQELAFVELARLFWRLAPVLATQSEPLAELPIKWSGTKSTRRSYAAMCDIPADISKEELERRIAVFGAGHYGISPTITLHGHQFRYVAPEADTKIESPGIVPTEQVVEPA